MTDNMSKEEARAALNEFLSRNHLELVTNVKAYVLKIVESIEPEHKKVVLPKEVGEQWDKRVDHYVSCQTVTDRWSAINYAIASLPSLGSSSPDYGDLAHWWINTQDSYTKLADAARYGWVAKPEKLYRVKVYGIDLPGVFYRKRDGGTLTFVQGGAGLPETEFTMGEIKHRHLENCEREEVTDDEQ
ncbi:hypothetical protein EFT87_12340 [Schleiferilactobacillus harbinensis]|uniref:hypothetical protein n=1 Tax=Schleiferilactobacillus harbinensis TaxID=304207 RepID=UPI0021A605EB|nr:hypothetical protein [Schleiferilactobacillus harbinensis]MCT2909440.1 hypothetical protein [Schleiferilactobacillus harbinensis]